MAGTHALPGTAAGTAPVPIPGKPLVDVIQKEVQDWDGAAIRYGILHAVTVTILLVVPVVIAAEASIAQTPLAWLSPWIPLLAIAVTLAAAVKETFAPGGYWRSYTRDSEDAHVLVARMYQYPPTSEVDYHAYETEWEDIEKRHDAHKPGRR